MTRTKQIIKKKEIFIPNEYTDKDGIVWIERSRGSYIKKDLNNNTLEEELKKLKEENEKLKEENEKLKKDYKSLISKCGAYAANMTKYKNKNKLLLDEIKNLNSQKN